MNPFGQFLVPTQGEPSHDFTEAVERFVDDLVRLGWAPPSTIKLGNWNDTVRFRHEASVLNQVWDPQFKMPPNIIGQVHGIKIVAPYGEWNYVKRDYDWQ